MVQRIHRYGRRGTTLTEVMVSSVLVATIGISLTALFYISAVNARGTTKQVIIEMNRRAFLNQIRDSVQQAALITLSGDGKDLTVEDLDGNEQRFSIAEGELRHFPDTGSADFMALFEDVAFDSIFEVTSIPERFQLVHILVGVRDPQTRDGLNFFYIDTRISTRVMNDAL